MSYMKKKDQVALTEAYQSARKIDESKKQFLKSIIQELLDLLNNNMNLEVIKQQAKDFIASKEINPQDKKLMLFRVDQANSAQSLYQYLINAMFKFQGMGVGRPDRDNPGSYYKDENIVRR